MTNLVFLVLDFLSDGKFHSGETMAQHFNVSRVSIWNAIAEAESLDVEIFSVRGKGYRLIKPIQLLNESKIKSAIGESANWFNIKVVDVIESTNSFLVKEAAKAFPHASCVAANIQTSGRGRRGRQWQSALGENLTFSFLWRFTCGAAALSGLSLAIGVALIRSLKKININEALVKWPNDILVFDEGRYKKLAGILIELQGDTDGQSVAIIGIGLNLNLSKKQLSKIDQPAIDVNSCIGELVDPNLLLGIMIKDLAELLAVFETNQFLPFKDEWLSYHAYQDKPIAITLGNNEKFKGRAYDVSPEGSLVIMTEQGEKSFSSGEVTVRES